MGFRGVRFLSSRRDDAQTCARETHFLLRGDARCDRFRSAIKIMHRRPLQACRRLSRGAKRANQCQPIRGGGVFAACVRRRAASSRAKISVPFRHMRKATRGFASRRSAAVYRCRHAPIFFRKSSLTVCGLALPPDAFITWPTNQPIAFGFVLASASLSGFLATISSTSFSIAPTSMT
jgi:hypothetical protein